MMVMMKMCEDTQSRTFIQHVVLLTALREADVHSGVDVPVRRADLKHHAGLRRRTVIRHLNAVQRKRL